MTIEVEQIINDYINSPTGVIKKTYPVIDNIDLEYHEYMKHDTAVYGVNKGQGWFEVNVYLNRPVEMEEDLWDTHNFDWAWMMDHHITKNVLKLFGIKKLPYRLYVYAPRDEEDYNNMLRANSPEDSKWKYIAGSGGLTY